MGQYQQVTTGNNLSVYVGLVETQHDAMRSYERGANASAPTNKPVGLLWNRTDYPGLGEVMTRWNGSAFALLMDLRYAQINANGSIAFAADQPMGGFKFTGMAAGTAAGHSVRYEQVVLLDGSNVWAGNQNAGGFLISNHALAVADDDVATLRLVKKKIPDTGYITLDGAGNGAFAFAAKPKALLLVFFKAGKYFPPVYIVGTAAGPQTVNVPVMDTAANTWTNFNITVTFSDSAPYCSIAGGASLSSADARFLAAQFN